MDDQDNSSLKLPDDGTSLGSRMQSTKQLFGPGSKYKHKNPAPGHGLCAICRHRRRKAIEEMYLNWYTPKQISDRFHVEAGLINSHCIAFNIDKDRAADTSRYYKAVIREHGPAFLASAVGVSEKFMMAILQQLDRVEGREQKARKNEADVKREELYIQDTLRRLQTECNLSKEEALKVLATEMPDIENWIS